MDPLTLALLLGAGWLVARSQSGGAAAGSNPTGVLGLIGAGGGSNPTGAFSSIAFAQRGPGSDPRNWFNGQKPGTVQIGGSPADRGWQPGQTLYKSASLASAAVGFTAGIGSLGVFGTSGLSVAVGGLLPFVGIGLVAVTTILAAIAAHHKAALAREGQVLNSTDPAMLQALILVAQATIYGEINSVAEAKAHTDTIISDWYNQVRSIQRGTWHYRGYQNVAAFIGSPFAKIYAQYPEQVPPDPFDESFARKPDPCNAACVVGHYWVERNAAIVLQGVSDILAGNHGELVLPEIPAHDTQNGFPEIRLVY
jgi:hypothetical protein